MSTNTFNCPHCQQSLKVRPEILGRVVSCPSCRNRFQLPSALGTAAEDCPPPVPEVATAPAMVAGQRGKGLSIAGMACGIAGLAISVTPCVWLMGVGPDLVGIVLSVVAMKRIKAGKDAGAGMAKAGLICGIIGIAFWLVQMMWFGSAMHDLDRTLRSM